MRKIFVFHTKANLYCSSDDGGKSANFNYHSPVRTRTAQLAHIGVATGRHRLRNWRVLSFKWIFVYLLFSQYTYFNVWGQIIKKRLLFHSKFNLSRTLIRDKRTNIRKFHLLLDTPSPV